MNNEVLLAYKQLKFYHPCSYLSVLKLIIKDLIKVINTCWSTCELFWLTETLTNSTNYHRLVWPMTPAFSWKKCIAILFNIYSLCNWWSKINILTFSQELYFIFIIEQNCKSERSWFCILLVEILALLSQSFVSKFLKLQLQH